MDKADQKNKSGNAQRSVAAILGLHPLFDNQSQGYGADDQIKVALVSHALTFV